MTIVKKGIALLTLVLAMAFLFNPRVMLQGDSSTFIFLAMVCWFTGCAAFIWAVVQNRRFLGTSIVLALVSLAVLSVASASMRTAWTADPEGTVLYLLLAFLFPITMAHKWLWFEKIDTG